MMHNSIQTFRRRASKRRKQSQLPIRSVLEQLEDRALLAALTWSPGINLPQVRAGASAIVSSANTILVFGGGTTTVNQLAPGSGSWSTASQIDLPRNYPGVASTGGKYLVYGGATGTTPLEEALTYDPYNIDNVQDAAVLHTPRTQFGYAGDANLPYAIGGLGNGGSVLGSVERYSAAQDSWSNVASLPQARFDFPAVNDGAGHILTFGGATANNATSVSSTVYRYTVATNSWQTMTPMPVATRDSAAVLASNGRIYVIGGSSGSATLATVQSYDPVADSWRTETDLPAPLTAATAVSDASGRIEVIGGYNSSHVAVSTVLVSQALNVPDTPPSITSTAPNTANTNSLYTYQVVATGNPQPTYSLLTAPSGMSITPGTGLIAWTPTLAQAGLNSVTVRATNVAGFVDQSFSVRALTPAPTIPTGLQVTGATTSTISLAWSPSTDSVGVAGYRVYRVTHTGWHGTVTQYTQYADVTGTSATVSVPNAGYNYTFAVAAYNASGNQSGYSSKVTATSQSPPTFLGPSSVSVIANHPLAFTLSASGNPATFSYSPVNVPSGMTVHPTTGLVSWTPSDANVGSGNYSFGISNGVGSITAVVGVTVSANLPNVTYTPTGTAIANQPYSVPFSQVNDPYNTSPVTYSLVNSPAGVTINPTTGLLEWTPGPGDVGTAAVTVRATNYAGVRDTTLSIPVYFASAVQNVVISNTTTTSATVNWQPPAFAATPVQGYDITASYVTRSGRFNTTHTLNFSTAGATTINLTGLPTSKTITVSVKAYDSAHRYGPAGSASFSTATATPTLVISGGPYTYDTLSHGVTAVALGVNGVTPVSGTFTYTYNGGDTLPIEPGTYAVEAIFNSNDPYYADTVATGSLLINPAPPVIVLESAQFTYDGAPHGASATAYALDGSTVVNGSFTYSYEGSPTPPTNPGLYAVAISFTSGDPRYASITTSDVLRIASTGALQPVLALQGGPFAYDGTAHAFSANAFRVNGVTPLSGTFSNFTYDGVAAVPTEAGTYLVAGEFYSRDPSYADATIAGTLTIQPVAPTISILDGYNYNGDQQSADAVAYGVDGATQVNGSYTFTYDGSSTPPTDVGTYVLAVSFTSEDANYTNVTAIGSITIDPATPSVSVTGGGYFIYDNTAHPVTATPYGVDGVTPLSGSPAIRYYLWDVDTDTYQEIAGAPLHAGFYLVEATYTSTDPNYSDSIGYDYIVIDRAMPNITIAGGPFNFDDQAHSATVSVTGLDGVTPVAGTIDVTYDGDAAVPTDGGVHAVVVIFTSSNPDYADALADGELIIYPAAHLAPNQESPWLTDLVWDGSPGADEVQFIQTDATTVLVVMLRQNGYAADTDGSFSGITGRIIAKGHDGDDVLDASALSTIPVTFEGGLGGDTLIGGAADDILRGESVGAHGDGAEGNDSISGGAGNDAIAGDGLEGGKDTIRGGSGNDSINGDGGDGLEGRADSIFGEDGDDTIVGGHGLDRLDGGNDNDLITGGDGAEANDIVTGGAGNDRLSGGIGRDLLIGGLGLDTLKGEDGDDLLVADQTSLDLNAAALLALQKEWGSDDDYDVRVAHLSGTAGGENGSTFLQPGTTVFDDEAEDDLTGGADLDWYHYNLMQDVLHDHELLEVETDTFGT